MTTPRGLLMDLDNTAYAYDPCHEAGLAAGAARLTEMRPNWAGADFRRDYNAARVAVKKQLGPRSAAVHCRLLYCKRLVEDRLGRSDLALAQALHDAYWLGYFAVMRPDPGCVETLAELRRRGVKLAWVTNFTTQRQFLKLQALGLADAADFLFTSEEAGADKPDQAVLRLALHRMKMSADEVWMLGDSLYDDFEMARAGGVRFVWFNRDDSTLPNPRPEALVRDWGQVREMMG